MPVSASCIEGCEGEVAGEEGMETDASHWVGAEHPAVPVNLHEQKGGEACTIEVYLALEVVPCCGWDGCLIKMTAQCRRASAESKLYRCSTYMMQKATLT